MGQFPEESLRKSEIQGPMVPHEASGGERTPEQKNDPGVQGNVDQILEIARSQGLRSGQLQKTKYFCVRLAYVIVMKGGRKKRRLVKEVKGEKNV